VHAILAGAKGISNRTVAALALAALWVFRMTESSRNSPAKLMNPCSTSSKVRERQ
jgi:hypothetical protein